MASGNFDGKPISLSKDRGAAQAERCKDCVPARSNANEASRDAVTPIWNLRRPTSGSPSDAPSGTPRTVAPTGNLGAQVARTRSGDKIDWSSNPPAGTRKTLTIKGVEYAFRYCPPGKFLMGAPQSEGGLFSNERQHYVILTHGFWTLETPVTQAMWRSIMGGNPSWFSATGGGKKKVVNLDTSNFPVECVSHSDCRSFLGLWSQNFDSVRYPLVKIDMLSEAEWEYACRAGKDGPYSGESLDTMGWYRNNSGGRTHEARGKSANAWGLYDMHGNVLEWCIDNPWWGNYSSSLVTNPMEEADWASKYILRGGAWNRGAKRCRSASRFFFNWRARRCDCGFRFALGGWSWRR